MSRWLLIVLLSLGLSVVGLVSVGEQPDPTRASIQDDPLPFDGRDPECPSGQMCVVADDGSPF